jgi:hypothetical protein
MTTKRKKPWDEMGTTFDKDFREDEGGGIQETPSDNQECKTDPEKAKPLINFKIAALPPCSAKNIRDGKACILQRKPYLKIYFPGHKKPKEQSEDVEWGRTDDGWGKSEE